MNLAAEPLSDAELERLQSLLERLPPPLEPLDASALDGYLCAVLLQPAPVPAARWLPGVFDLEGRAPPAGPLAEEIAALARRRHAELDAAIGQRRWFDPWVFPDGDEPDGDEPDDEIDGDHPDGGDPSAVVLPWVAGFAAGCDRFPALLDAGAPALVEPLALIFLHLGPGGLEDAEAIDAAIEAIEPPPDLAEAVQDLVRAVMLIADVTRPRAAAPRRPPPRPGARGRPRSHPTSRSPR